MKNSRLIYSNFSSKLIDREYIIRSCWIVIGAVALAILLAFESDSGFSGELSAEGIVLYLSTPVLFFINYLSREYKSLQKLLVLLCFGLTVIFAVHAGKAFHHYQYMLHTSIYMSLYFSLIAVVSLRRATS